MYRLALACGASGDQVQEIRIVDENLNQAWRFFDNSPKRTNMYFKIQLELANISLVKVDIRKLRKSSKRLAEQDGCHLIRVSKVLMITIWLYFLLLKSSKGTLYPLAY